MPALRNVSTEAVLRYWRTSVADEMVASLDSMSKGYEVEPADVAKGQLPREAVQWLQARANEKPASQKAALDAGDMEPDAEPLNIVFCLKVMSPNLSHAAAGQHRSLHFVAGVQAVLQPDGRVLKTDNTMPWINRAYLSPSDDDTSVGEVQTSDEWMRDHPMLAENWTQMLEWFDSYWAAVTKGALPKHYAVSQVQMVDIDPKGAKGALTHILKLYDHILETSQRSALMSRFCLGRADHQVITTATRLSSFSAQRGTMSIRHGLANSQADAVAAFTLLQPGEVLAVKGPPGTGKTTLLQSIVATETVRSAMAGLEPSVIVGVSTNNNAVTNISESMNAILRENDMAGRPAWARRWIKDVESYGLYIPSPGKLPAAQKANLVVAYSTGNRAENWSGLPQRERNRTTGDAERAAWLQSCSGVYGNTDSILSGCEQIRADLHVLEHRLSGLQKALQSKHELDVYWLDRMGPDGSAREFVDNARAGHHARLTELKLLVEAAEAETRHHKHKLDLLRDEQEAEKQAAASRLGGQQALLTRARILKGDILAAIAPSGLMEFCALLMPSLRAGAAARQCIRARTLVTEHELSPGFHHVLGSQQPAAWSMAAAEVVGHLEGVVAAMLDEVSPYASSQSDIRDATRKLGAAEKSLAEATTNKDLARRAADVDLAELDGKLHSWTSATVALRASASVLASDYSLLEPVALDIVELDRLADCSVRAEMFQKAMRYWEGRWLMESEKIQSQLLSPPTGANKAGVTARLRRWSMLTPILVSTLHMLPKLLGCYGRVEKEHYCYDLIDVLVMDESGQVAPHLAGAAFSLAKRSVVVGDIYQLEPIVNLSPAADYGNARQEGVASFWTEDGTPDCRVASSQSDGLPQGSVMRVAQEATSFTSSGQGNAPGIFLVEHRRCRADIIGFCNDLIYNGLLQPMRQEPTAVPPLPALAWAHVQGASLQAGGSQYNEKEAGAVAQWIVDNAAAWVAHYRPSKIGHKLALAEIVAVLTPFGAQKQLIQHKLAALTSIYDLTAITIGTVHAMQGAERDIVVFSPTSDDSVKGLFLDRKPNLLNVAVSRAKDSFVLIGDMRVMRRPGSKPSALLGKALLARGKELLDVGGNYRFSTSMALKGERISTLKRHVELLNEAVMDAAAGDEVVIVSPWVTLRAVEFPPFLGNCKSAVERGVSIHVVYDAELTEAYLRKDAKNGQVFELLSEANIQVTAVNKIHSKTILTREAITEGSFNWLSAQRYPDDAYIRHETSWRISGPAAETAILEAYEELRQLGVTFTGSLPAAASTKPAVPPTQKVMDVQPGRRLNSPFSMAAAHARVRQLDQERKP